MDFTSYKYIQLLQILKSQGFLFRGIAEFSQEKIVKGPFILLRHDVEKHYKNALKYAQIENHRKIIGTFYFRIQPQHFNSTIIEKIVSLGHEIGYHYDDLSVCKGKYNEAIKRFEKNLNLLRQIFPVKTISMEGAPLSKYDNRDLWKKFNYRDFGIKFEPYFDLDFDEVAYYTDTGRRWDGRFAMRDKVWRMANGENRGIGNHSNEETKRLLTARFTRVFIKLCQ